MPCGITQFYLTPSSGENPAFTPAEAGVKAGQIKAAQIFNGLVALPITQLTVSKY